jgi:hypothetical protein
MKNMTRVGEDDGCYLFPEYMLNWIMVAVQNLTLSASSGYA